jgi:hypothetical protein
MRRDHRHDVAQRSQHSAMQQSTRAHRGRGSYRFMNAATETSTHRASTKCPAPRTKHHFFRKRLLSLSFLSSDGACVVAGPSPCIPWCL